MSLLVHATFGFGETGGMGHMVLCLGHGPYKALYIPLWNLIKAPSITSSIEPGNLVASLIEAPYTIVGTRIVLQ